MIDLEDFPLVVQLQVSGLNSYRSGHFHVFPSNQEPGLQIREERIGVEKNMMRASGESMHPAFPSFRNESTS